MSTLEDIISFVKYEQPDVVMMVGLPRSGKSTLADAISAATSAPIVCPDDIRLALYGSSSRYIPEAENHVWAIAKTMVSSLLRRHHTVVLDATNMTTERRKEWQGFTVVAVVVGTDAELCKVRAEENGRRDLISVIERMDKTQTGVEYYGPCGDVELYPKEMFDYVFSVVNN